VPQEVLTLFLLGSSLQGEALQGRVMQSVLVFKKQTKPNQTRVFKFKTAERL
jgi:hypothetical protein